MLNLRCRCFSGFILVLLVASSLTSAFGGSNADSPPVDIVRERMVERLEVRLKVTPDEYKDEYRLLLDNVDMLDEVPSSIALGKTVLVNRTVGSMKVAGVSCDIKIVLRVDHNEVLYKSWGWDFYWHKYLRQGEYEARMPNVLAIRVNETGSITDFTDFWLRNYPLGGFEVKVTLEKAVNKALKVAKPDMQWIGVKGISRIETYFQFYEDEKGTRGNPGVYYPGWCVEISYDKAYVRPDGVYWIDGYYAIIWADTGEVESHGEQGFYGPPPEGIQPKQDISTPTFEPTSVAIILVAILAASLIVAYHRWDRLFKRI